MKITYYVNRFKNTIIFYEWTIDMFNHTRFKVKFRINDDQVSCMDVADWSTLVIVSPYKCETKFGKMEAFKPFTVLKHNSHNFLYTRVVLYRPCNKFRLPALTFSVHHNPVFQTQRHFESCFF
jgi:hypothetical protein